MTVLFVCTGNTCRSPMAEGYLNSKKLKNVTAMSAGLFADGSYVSRSSASVMKEKGIDISHHISHSLTKADIDKADKIICMSPSHRDALIAMGAAADKISVLGFGISDPYGGDEDVYRVCRDEIFAEIDKLFPEITVRKSEMDDRDAEDIAEIEKLTFSEPWSRTAIIDSYENGTIFLIAEANGGFAGYCGINAVLDEGYITNIAVMKRYRRKGIATALLTAAEKEARNKKLAFISLEVRKSNTAAICLYEKLGYTVCGERKDFYRDPKENALIMTKRF